MSNLIRIAKQTYREDGTFSLLKKGFIYVYDSQLRSILPRQTVLYNGIPVRAGRLGDSLIPWQNTDIPAYESALLRGIRNYTQKEDTVVIVGGGWGVSSVIAATQVGTRGEVITFEGAAPAARNVRETLRLNNISDTVSVEQAVVGEGISLRGDGDGAEMIEPEELPDCDVLVLDCEGAEMSILDCIEIQPRVVIVETHGVYNAPKAEVKHLLESRGYEITDYGIAEERLADTCREEGIYVLAAVL